MDRPYEIQRGDCLELMPHLPSKSIDLIFADLPFGTTSCAWDVVIPFEPLWAEYKRLLAPGGCILLFGSQPFTSLLVCSNLPWFKYEIIWNKNKCGSPGLKKYRPMKVHENVLVFAPGNTVYNPQMEKGDPYKRLPPKKIRCNNHKYGFAGTRSAGIDNKGTRFPKSVQFSPRDFSAQQQIHPTQKPVRWCRWLVRTYTNAGARILDNTCGVASSGVATILEGDGRTYIGMDKDVDPKTGECLNYVEKGIARCERAFHDAGTVRELKQPKLFVKAEDTPQIALFER